MGGPIVVTGDGVLPISQRFRDADSQRPRRDQRETKRAETH